MGLRLHSILSPSPIQLFKATNSGSVLDCTALMERKFTDAEMYYHQAITLEPLNANNHYKLYNLHKRMRSYGGALGDITTERRIRSTEVNFSEATSTFTVGKVPFSTVQFRCNSECVVPKSQNHTLATSLLINPSLFASV